MRKLVIAAGIGLLAGLFTSCAPIRSVARDPYGPSTMWLEPLSAVADHASSTNFGVNFTAKVARVNDMGNVSLINPTWSISNYSVATHDQWGRVNCLAASPTPITVYADVAGTQKLHAEATLTCQ